MLNPSSPYGKFVSRISASFIDISVGGIEAEVDRALETLPKSLFGAEPYVELLLRAEPDSILQ